jgi:hypothetical protein
MRIRGCSIDDIRPGEDAKTSEDRRRVREGVERNRILRPVITDSETATHYEPILEVVMEERQGIRAPREADLRTEIMVIGVVEVPSQPNANIRQLIRGRPEHGYAEIVVLFVEGAKVLPAQA